MLNLFQHLNSREIPHLVIAMSVSEEAILFWIKNQTFPNQIASLPLAMTYKTLNLDFISVPLAIKEQI